MGGAVAAAARRAQASRRQPYCSSLLPSAWWLSAWHAWPLRLQARFPTGAGLTPCGRVGLVQGCTGRKWAASLCLCFVLARRFHNSCDLSGAAALAALAGRHVERRLRIRCALHRPYLSGAEAALTAAVNSVLSVAPRSGVALATSSLPAASPACPRGCFDTAQLGRGISLSVCLCADDLAELHARLTRSARRAAFGGAGAAASALLSTVLFGLASGRAVAIRQRARTLGVGKDEERGVLT